MLTREEALAQLTGPGGDFELLDTTINDVPMRVYRNAPASLRDLLIQSREFADREWLIYDEERITYAEHFVRVARLANWMRANGIDKGDRVGIGMRNYPEWAISFWACHAIGAVAVTLNAWWIGPELVYGLTDSGCKLAILDGERIDRLQSHREELPDLQILGTRCEPLPDIVLWEEVQANASDTLPDTEVVPEDIASIMYTSGTTGFPKGALQTHRNHITNITNTLLSGAVSRLIGVSAGLIDPDAPPAIPCALQTFPFFHIGGLSGLYVVFASGGKLALMYRWDAHEALDIIEHEGVMSMSAVPTVARQLVERAEAEGRNLDSLMSMASGGAPVPADLINRIGSQFQKRIAPGNGYGATETASAIIANGGEDYFQHPHSVGRPAATVDVRIAAENGQDCAVEEIGELWVRGPNIFAGYWQKPEATADAFAEGGWFKTGDLGYVDADGFYYVVDRKKDVVIRGGENIYCAEVENALHEHLDILDVAIIGLPHRMLGEEVAAVIEARPGADLTAADIQAHVAQRLARYNVPTQVFFTEEPMPRTASGKILKRELKQKYSG